jgi:hypothetical protein
MTRVTLMVAALLLSGCHLMRPAPPGPIGEVPVAPVARASFRLATVRSPVADAPDTAVTTATWTIPADDGRGPVDSMRVVVGRFTGGAVGTLVAPTATSFEDRQPIPFGEATWTVAVQVCRYRRDIPSCVSAEVDLMVVDVAPAPVGGLEVTARKVPPSL